MARQFQLRRIASVMAAAVILVLAAGAPPAEAAPQTVTFNYTGGNQTWTVPAGVTQATFDVYGAAGGGFGGVNRARGGRATATLAVTPGATITIVVGGVGGDTRCDAQTPPGAGGFNGGGGGGSGFCEAAGGGGASDVRIGGTDLTNRVLVAGGGGGASGNGGGCGVGGAGGGLVGLQGGVAGCLGGTGGNQDGTSGSGQLGQGSPGANAIPELFDVAGGGGGGGYYGGAGGRRVLAGGGGSGFGPAGTTFETGARDGSGLITVTFTPPDTAPPSVSVAFAPNGQAGWFTTATASGTAGATDAMTGGGTIASLACSGTGVSQGAATGIGTGNASRPLTVSGEGSRAVSCSATDDAGNTGMGSATVKIDSVAPTVQRNAAADSCSVPGTNGWCRGTQSAGFSASDATSGLAAANGCAAGAASCNFTKSSTTEGAMVTIPSGSVADVAGNSNPGVSAGPFKVDRTPPAFAGRPPNVSVDQTGPAGAPASFPTPAATDALDPMPAVACSSPSDGTFPVGVTTVTCTATDAAGNTATTSFTVTVRRLFCGGERATLFAQPNVPLSGTAGRDVIVGTPGRDVIRAGTGNDLVCGDDGDDELHGEGGDDTLHGEGGADTIDGGLGDDTLHGGEGDDRLTGGGGNDALSGDAGADTLEGDAGNDQLNGGTGNDTLRGGTGNDTLADPDAANALIDGGPGTDSCAAQTSPRLNCEALVP